MSTATADVKKTGNTLIGRLTLPVIDLDEARKPAYAWVGAADLAIARATAVPASVKGLPARVKALPAEAKSLRATAQARVGRVSDRATETYGALATRGEKLVGQIRRQPATQEAIAEGKRAVQKAEASAHNAKRSTGSAVKAAEGAADKIG